ncbi:DUF4350 domain-containing protein [Kitasatospora sp. NPDC094015]|uniref:DUF4350 domain-containing protein n=1 Tax=Kitasatospora sp. NPDC094015 TaxID=3155205 RepID=UPI003324736D
MSTAPHAAPPAPAPAPAAAAGPATPEPPASTSLAPGRRRLWLRSRWYLLTAALLVVLGLLLGGLAGRSTWPPLDPRSPDPQGARAAVVLVQREGVDLRTVDDVNALAGALREPGTTVVLPRPDLLSPAQLARLGAVPRGSTGRLILIAPEQGALDAFARGTTLVTAPDGFPDLANPISTPPACRLPEAVRADTADLGGLLYDAGAGDTGCYPRHGHQSLVRHADTADRDTVVLGTGRPFTNNRLDDDGNAALALGLLGAHQHLVWYLPDYNTAAPAAHRKQFSDYIPSGWNWAAVQLMVAAVLAALWRGRRLGPVVAERLPVVVRATETTEGRARLYHRAKARGRAADALRRATAHRLAPALGVPTAAGQPEPIALCTAVADRLGRSADDIRALLYGGPPTDDAALLRLTDDLDALERQVRQP